MRYALIYGALSGAIVIAVIVAGLAFDLPSHLQSEWFGYLVMLVALSLIFIGVKRYRDVECGGVIRFGRAFALGLGIATVAGVIYVAGWETYQAFSKDDFIAGYNAGVLRDMCASGANASELAAMEAQLGELAQNYRNPLWRIPMTFAEIFPVGLLMALISAAVLRNPRAFPARRV